MKFKYKDKVKVLDGFYRTHVGTCEKWHKGYTYKISIFGETVTIIPFYEIKLEDCTVIELREEYLELV